MLFKRRIQNSGQYPPFWNSSYGTFRKRKISRRTKIITAICAFILLAVPIFLLAKGIYAYRSIVQRHTGVSSEVLTKNESEFDSKTEAATRVNILLLGVGDADHAGSTLADTMMVASIDPRTKDVAILSLPRDLYVRIPKHGKYKLNAAHALGEQQETGAGPDLAKMVVGQVLDVPIHNYLRVDFSGFKKVVDVLGGVSVDVPQPLSDPEYPCEKDERRACGFSLRTGTYVMDGALALKYARCRKGNCGDDFGRATRQQQVLLALRAKALGLSTLSSPAKIADIIDTVGAHVRTDLTMDELTRLAEILKDVDQNQVRPKVIDSAVEGLVQVATVDGASVVIPVEGDEKFDGLADFAHSLFYDRHIIEEKIPLTIIDATSQPNLVAATIKRLQGYRYTITEVQKTEPQATSELIDGTGGRAKYTKRYLETRFGLTAKEDTSRGAGLTLIIGGDTLTASNGGH